MRWLEVMSDIIVMFTSVIGNGVDVMEIFEPELISSSFVDIEPPWIQCPGDVITETDEHQRSANISLSAPMLRDNSGDEVSFASALFTPVQISNTGLCVSF